LYNETGRSSIDRLIFERSMGSESNGVSP